ncbi:hypothetical protein [Clostridium beijerinckii]|uniref:Uncharacterized protein n=1 Tax=Clostridium beijerinckii TaxID=1520 RepID=A0A9Q5CUL6_CLOBE|nr:hypothetical protein [Clostridium beijerinckii]AQS04013.1 hypothetical protein CLBIJ_14280 [Clostridium beijerinckii]MBA2884104.1 hypothetical protein [Clostridium beijerinckii]MBA2899287.1 hypothetical protein [Clostridium beijerinckii]MBA2908689.1 hypothetical protein [Clostridium beijerinckii]MBA9016441.1 hypothetical protein [Clostridium beijerinckii]
MNKKNRFLDLFAVGLLENKEDKYRDVIYIRSKNIINIFKKLKNDGSIKGLNRIITIDNIDFIKHLDKKFIDNHSSFSSYDGINYTYDDWYGEPEDNYFRILKRIS